MARTLRRILLAALLGGAAAFGAAGVYLSGRILGPDAPPGTSGQVVLAHDDSTITLASTFKARRPGRWAIVWPGGYGHIGPLIRADDHQVLTRFSIAYGRPPDSTSRLAGFAPKADPLTWFGIPFETRMLEGRAGPLPAWWLPGRDSTWAVFVHGRAATRAEVLRMLPAYRSLGLPCLVLAYRNDPDGPRVGDGSYRLGLSEWEDVEDAVRAARARGARGVVLVGCSMGGGIVAQFLRHSSERDRVRAVVLDAPALDWAAILSEQGAQGGVPALLMDWGRTVASWRTGLAWDELDQIAHAAAFTHPILLFHGDADDVIPIGLSGRFARARPDLVTFETFAGAGHVESANVDSARYARTIAGWLRRRGIGAEVAP